MGKIDMAWTTVLDWRIVLFVPGGDRCVDRRHSVLGRDGPGVIEQSAVEETPPLPRKIQTTSSGLFVVSQAPRRQRFDKQRLI